MRDLASSGRSTVGRRWLLGDRRDTITIRQNGLEPCGRVQFS